MHLAEVRPGGAARVRSVGGTRAFRRRLLELGLLPGTEVRVMRVAPLGDPVELLVRGCSLSIRQADAATIEVVAVGAPAVAVVAAGAEVAGQAS